MGTRGWLRCASDELGNAPRGAYSDAMPIYSYLCRGCGTTKDDVRGIHDPDPGITCGACGERMGRLFHPPSLTRPLVVDGHFNHSLGAYVRNSADFRSQLSRKNDEMSDRLGYEQRLVPVAPGDIEPPGAREQAYKRQREREGRPAQKVYL